MIGIVFASLLTTAIGPTAAIADQQMPPEQMNVAFEQLAAGDSAEAIEELRRSEYANDPARLINLGTAYAQSGDYKKAAKFFRAALASGTQYRLELADGSWMDSRQAARLALANLNSKTTLAMR
ncbi:tetratricopeptide repeat protein [Altererythrobacter indicus]|uniref:Tetratricopeptide repeat protein n=1 Tax=Altericroceibacterium indicum TaxID=374177 RepID=A0A845A8X2_9SPHN|nr:tetratricopeptide repeat protein [Altericroceibacterium indicum]MXP25006.1 tetratricopeptide repeat protein [Altericroceibacterium indicum]